MDFEINKKLGASYPLQLSDPGKLEKACEFPVDYYLSVIHVRIDVLA